MTLTITKVPLCPTTLNSGVTNASDLFFDEWEDR